MTEEEEQEQEDKNKRSKRVNFEKKYPLEFTVHKNTPSREWRVGG